MACDARSKFMPNAIPHLGKYTKKIADAEDVRQHADNVRAASPAVDVWGNMSPKKKLMLRLLQNVWCNMSPKKESKTSGAAIGMSLPTAGSRRFPSCLRETYNLAYVGTLRKNKRESPDQMLGKKIFLGSKCFWVQRRHGTGQFCKWPKQDPEKAGLTCVLHAL